MPEPLRALLLESSPDDARRIAGALRRDDVEPYLLRVNTPAALSEALARHPWDVVLGEPCLPCCGAAEVAALLRRAGRDLPFIAVSGAVGEEAVVEAMRAGADDFVSKANLARLLPAVERALRDAPNRAREARHQALLAALPGLLLRLDRGGRVLERAGASADGWADWPQVGQEPREVLPSALSAALVADVQQVLGTGQPCAVAYRLAGEGRQAWFEGCLVPCGPDDVLALLQDVTEHRRLEEQWRQSQKLEAVGRLAGGVAHDFNNLLQVVLSYAEFVGGGLPADHPVQEDLGQILVAARRGASLVRQLLAFSRQQPVEPERLNLNQALDELRKFLARTLGEDITVQLDLEPTLPAIRISPIELQQVLLNLAVNARDAMPNGGALTLRTRAGGPGEVRLEVSDTGTGMPPEVAAHVFDPYFTTKEGEGSGLGLATVSGIVDQAGGRIELKTALGRGTTFRLCLPAADGVGAPARRPPAPISAAGRGEVVLLIEDEQAIRAGVARALTAHGYRVVTAASGEEALRTAAGLPRLDLLLADVVMTGLSGPEVAERLTAAHPGLRLLFISGYADQQRLAAHDFGPAGLALLPKPFRPQDLLAHVRRALDGGGARPQDKVA